MKDPRCAVQERIARDYQTATHPDRVSADGVVVTPCEIVDYQVRAVIDRLAMQCSSLADHRVRILDPFGGTGIYLARLIQLAPLTATEKVDLATRCRMVEIDAAACNVARDNLATVMTEETGQSAIRPAVICADTFTLGDEVWELAEADEHDAHPNDRLAVVVGNPPYSVGAR